MVKHPRTPLSPYLEWDIGVQNEASQQNCCLATSSLGKISAPTEDVLLPGQKNSSFPHVVIFLSLCLVPQCSVIFTSGIMFVCLPFDSIIGWKWVGLGLNQSKFRFKPKVYQINSIFYSSWDLSVQDSASQVKSN